MTNVNELAIPDGERRVVHKLGIKNFVAFFILAYFESCFQLSNWRA